VQDVADSCRTGAATNVIFGLALGYKSVIIPIFAIAFSIFLSFSLAAMYGVAVAALGMLSTIATGLAIDAYGPISDNAGGIAEMAGMSHRIRERTDALDAAGNTTAAIGKVHIAIAITLSDATCFLHSWITMCSVLLFTIFSHICICKVINSHFHVFFLVGFCNWFSSLGVPCPLWCFCEPC
jgi:Na+/H+-translocating membrane pyrophosphatase